MSRRKSNGLGDTIEKITTATGIKKVVEVFSELTGIDCGCEERKQKLNAMFSYQTTPKCLSKSQYDEIKNLPKNTNKLNLAERKVIARIHADIFQHKYAEPCTCAPKIWFQWLGDLNAIAETYASELT